VKLSCRAGSGPRRPWATPMGHRLQGAHQRIYLLYEPKRPNAMEVNKAMRGTDGKMRDTLTRSLHLFQIASARAATAAHHLLFLSMSPVAYCLGKFCSTLFVYQSECVCSYLPDFLSSCVNIVRHVFNFFIKFNAKTET
jgi:hypothetical protein